MAWDWARTLKWLVISLAITVGVTFVLWQIIGPGALFGFLFLPFLPFAFGGGRRHSVETVATPACPVCGFSSVDPDVRYCPRDGQRLR